MAAVGTDDGKTVISRGWYRIDPGKCLHPDVTGQPKQIFSFAEAVDGENRALKFRDKPLNWGGATQLCTRESKFEINEQNDCGNRGLSRNRLCRRRHERRRQDAAVCDAMMGSVSSSLRTPGPIPPSAGDPEFHEQWLSRTPTDVRRWVPPSRGRQ